MGIACDDSVAPRQAQVQRGFARCGCFKRSACCGQPWPQILGPCKMCHQTCCSSREDGHVKSRTSPDAGFVDRHVACAGSQYARTPKMALGSDVPEGRVITVCCVTGLQPSITWGREACCCCCCCCCCCGGAEAALKLPVPLTACSQGPDACYTSKLTYLKGG